ncbi:unnamed protein product [Adineta ricciae]|uniref:Extended synaptotagmin-2 n=1 Tax=Adineta ricciae TaxID=249248 RepID=A0A814KAI2_ADIRI|nr:unnamed protein product [Adineta ricciae]CAF1420468.1 unnamed protein product [Adineta ricciae]
MENLASNLKEKLTGTSFDANSEKTAPPINPGVLHQFRKIQIPLAKIGLGSTEADLVQMAKKYLEIVGLVLFVWIFGYFHFSVSWILLAVFIYLFRQRQRSQFKERHRMLNEINKNEEQYIKARLDELPSWVFFPDVERAEWVNKIIKQAWPYANKYMDKAIFHDIMIPMIRSTSPALSDFSFEKLDLGEIPPRIGGVKVYTDNVRDQIMMDMEVFYAGDARIKSKVKGIVCGIKDIQFVGELRVILSPLINTIPLFGAVTYFFLRKPSIDFKLTDAGTLMDIPGLNDLMLVQINDIVASMMVLPNRQVFPLVTDIPTGHLRWSNPQGVVRVIVIEAHNLVKADITLLGKGKSDPFVKVKTQGNVEYKTKTMNNTTDPRWNEVFEFVVEQSERDVVDFEIYDEDPGKDDFLGRAQFSINSLLEQQSVETELTLKDVKKGSLKVFLQYFHLSTQRSALDIIERTNRQMIKQEKLSKALLVVFIDRCTNLPASKKTRREPNPFCRIQVDNTERKTHTLESQTNPSFEHISQILCSNPLQQQLKIEVRDARSNNDIIGYLELPIKNILDTDSMTIDTQEFPLKSSTEPLDRVSIVLRLSLHILSPVNSNASESPTASTPLVENSNRQNTVAELPNKSILENNLITDSSSKFANEQATTPENRTLLVADDPDLESSQFGQVKVGIRYAANRKALSVTIYACKDLINVHEQNLPDAYVRVYLIPDFKKDKKKTKSVHDTVDPVFDDLFEWSASLSDIHQQHLLISVKNNSPLFASEQTYMGDLQIDLSNLDAEKNSIAWYALQEPNTSAGGLIKIKYDTPNNVQTHL